MPMNFRHRKSEEPEINLIPFIDVLLVVLIFLMLTTTYTRFTEMKVNLPTASAQATKQRPKEMIVMVTSDSRYMVNNEAVEGRSVEMLAAALSRATGAAKDSVVIIRADAAAPHQSVINVMDAARRVGLSQLTFATRGQQGETGSPSAAAAEP